MPVTRAGHSRERSLPGSPESRGCGKKGTTPPGESAAKRLKEASSFWLVSVLAQPGLRSGGRRQGRRSIGVAAAASVRVG